MPYSLTKAFKKTLTSFDLTRDSNKSTNESTNAIPSQLLFFKINRNKTHRTTSFFLNPPKKHLKQTKNASRSPPPPSRSAGHQVPDAPRDAAGAGAGARGAGPAGGRHHGCALGGAEPSDSFEGFFQEHAAKKYSKKTQKAASSTSQAF